MYYLTQKEGLLEVPLTFDFMISGYIDPNSAGVENI